MRVTGKLRYRGDQFSLVCEQVLEYELSGAAGESLETKNGATGPSGHEHTENSEGGANGVSFNVGDHRTIILGVTESDDPASDAYVLREVIGVLLEYPGKDRVNLRINTGGRNVMMELPVVTTGCCESLKGRLEALLGPQTVTMEREPGLNGAHPAL